MDLRVFCDFGQHDVFVTRAVPRNRSEIVGSFDLSARFEAAVQHRHTHGEMIRTVHYVTRDAPVGHDRHIGLQAVFDAAVQRDVVLLPDDRVVDDPSREVSELPSAGDRIFGEKQRVRRYGRVAAVAPQTVEFVFQQRYPGSQRCILLFQVQVAVQSRYLRIDTAYNIVGGGNQLRFRVAGAVCVIVYRKRFENDEDQYEMDLLDEQEKLDHSLAAVRVKGLSHQERKTSDVLQRATARSGSSAMWNGILVFSDSLRSSPLSNAPPPAR